MTHDYTLLPFLSSKKLVTGFLLLLCLLMASYGPMTTYSSAQSATSVQLQELKQKSLPRLIAGLQVIKKLSTRWV